MAAVTRPDIRSAIIFRADLPAAEPRRVSDTQLDTLIDRSLRRLGGILGSMHSEDFQQYSQPITLAAASGRLASDFARIVHVLWQIEATGTTQPKYLRLGRMTDNDWVNRGDGTLFTKKWNQNDPPKWRIGKDPSGLKTNDYIYFTPASTVTETLLLVVEKDWTFYDDTEPLNIHYAWEEWIVLDCLVAIRQRDKQDASDIFADRERTEQRIREQAPERFLDDRNTVIDRDPLPAFLGVRFT